MSNEMQTTNRRTNLQILDDKRKELGEGLSKYKQYLDVIPINKQEQFKNNFLELATQDYLLSIVDVKELVRFASIITKTGLDISPSSKEVYIIPFDTKANNIKVMLPQAIIPLNGMQQLAYQKGFLLTMESVFKFDDGSFESESKLSRMQQSYLRTADPKWVDDHFIGFDVVLEDLRKELPTQTKFVDLNYVQEATKTIKDNRWKLQTWRHKAVRRAYGDFMIPKGRKIEAFEEIEALNDSILENADILSDKTLTLENEQALQQLGIKLQKFNGIALASNFQGKEKYLEEYGFVKNGGNWSIPYVEKPSQIPAPKNVEPKKENKGPISPAAKLFSYLNKKQLDNEQIKVFVNDVLGLTKEDTEGINEVLADLKLLDLMIDEYVNSNSQQNISDEKIADTLF
ncbi:hypothetical protein [Aliarcobacter lanthieri]|uniref:hypothetical protein n=1 Tax=Aliarcobacter lanthieri TaxID=1355374 RepID=UPI00047B7EFA|nr:hypothetical protein [Aliarcobacter lanthieri]QKF59215.1 hypothetical protein ALANTH_1106 [Aliarcobacter lanthieri]